MNALFNPAVRPLLQEDVDYLVQKIPASLAQFSKELGIANVGIRSGNALDGLLKALYLNQSQDEIWQLLRYAQQLALLNFKLHFEPTAFSAEILGQSMTLTPTPAAHFVGFEEWKNAFDLALLNRDGDGIQYLCQLSVDAVVDPQSPSPGFDRAFYCC